MGSWGRLRLWGLRIGYRGEEVGMIASGAALEGWIAVLGDVVERGRWVLTTGVSTDPPPFVRSTSVPYVILESRRWEFAFFSFFSLFPASCLFFFWWGFLQVLHHDAD